MYEKYITDLAGALIREKDYASRLSRQVRDANKFREANGGKAINPAARAGDAKI